MGQRFLVIGAIMLASVLSASGCASSRVDAPAPAESQPRVLVLGATGKLGSDTVKVLLERGYAVTAFVRPSSDRARLQGLDVSYAVGDLTQDADIESAFSKQKYRAVIDCSARRSSDGSFYDVLMRSVVRWGKPAGLQQIVLHSSVGVGESGEIPEVAAAFGTLQGEKKRFYDTAMAEKERAEKILRDGDVKFTIIRNWALMFEGTPATGRGRLTEDLQALGRITRPDLARLAVDCIGNEACFDKTFNALDDAAL